jgi:hypothetical protein
MHNDVPEPLTSVLEEIPCGIASTDEEGRLETANQRFSEMVGEETLTAGRPMGSFFDVGGHIYFETHVRPLLKMQGWVRELSLRLRDKRPVLLSGRTSDRGAAVWVLLETPDRHSYERELLAARRKAENAERKTAETAASLRVANEGLASTIVELRQSQLYIRKLEGILPICMYCKAVRSDDDTDWLHLDRYLMERNAVTLSHSICPGCDHELASQDAYPASL